MCFFDLLLMNSSSFFFLFFSSRNRSQTCVLFTDIYGKTKNDEMHTSKG